MSIDGYTNQSNAVYTNEGIILIRLNSDICYNRMGLADILRSEIS